MLFRSAQIRNAYGSSGSDGGIFLDGPQPLKLPGSDGLVNTPDDSIDIESIPLPGADRILGTADDKTIALSGYTREITIRDVPGESGQLRSITVTVIFQNGTTRRTYTLTSLISAYA